MTESIHRLVYYSRNRMVGTGDKIARGIATILSTSQTNNGRVGVTGALMFNSGCFAQVLEGPRAAVENVCERIQQDDRHGKVSLLAFEPAPARPFQNWSMGFVGASVEDAARYVVEDNGFDLSRMVGDALFETLLRVTLDVEKQAAA